RMFAGMNGGEPVPALAFFHIAVPEYRNVNEANKNVYGCCKEGSGIGAPEVNSGFLLSCIEMGDVMGIFVGHDHDNDYVGLQNGIALAYGRVSGFNAYGDLTRGARIVELTEGKRQFDTWIATPQGKELNFYYPWGITGEDLSQPFLQAKEIMPEKQGVSYTYYEGNYKQIADVPHVGKKMKEGIMANFSVKESSVKDHFAYEFQSYLQIPEKDIYLFKIKSDDGAQMFIDGQLVVDNGKGHSMSEYTRGKIGLEKGFHEVRVVYYEDYMGEGLEITIESRKMKEQSIPDQMLFVP
ncbi:MAG: PA14 domain-containing protein, partial [Parabacteroides sp.]|nr:PA14 domain-containing protein [Parabacteroides sp.]